MPIELMYTDSEIVKIQKQLLKKITLNSSDLQLLKEINDYMKK